MSTPPPLPPGDASVPALPPAHDTRPGPASPILARVNFLLPVGSDGLVFIGGHYSSLQTIARLFSDDSSALPVGSYRSSRLLSADSPGASDTPATSWLTVQQLEEDGGGLGPVSGIVAIGGSGTRRCNRPTFFDGRHETPPTEVFRDFGDVESPGPRVTPEGFRAVLATGGRGDTAGSGEDPATGLCTLEHGLALDTVAEGSTGLPAGATLFTVPLTPRILEGCRCHRPGHDIRATRGASGKVEGDDARGGGHLLLFSDRARWTTCVSMVSRDGVFLPVVEPKVWYYIVSRAPVPPQLFQGYGAHETEYPRACWHTIICVAVTCRVGTHLETALSVKSG